MRCSVEREGEDNRSSLIEREEEEEEEIRQVMEQYIFVEKVGRLWRSDR